jgi:phenylacetate-coenzyme A ligase PaaK-like adenylate-forming protein
VVRVWEEWLSDDLQRIRADLDRLSRSSVDEIRSQQDRRLAEIVRFHFNNERNTSYRTLLNAHGIKDEAELPRTVDDIGRLPMISRQFLEAADYSRRPCVPFEDVRKIVETTGTSGSPLRVPHTRESMRRCYGEFIARSAVLGGMDPGDPSYAILHWIPGGKDDWASYAGTLVFQELVGAERSMLVSTHTTPAEHWHNLTTHRPTWAFSTPVFFLAFAGYAESTGIDLRSCSLRHILLAGASGAPEDIRFLTETYGLEGVHFVYGTTESFIPAAQLPDRSGYLCFEDECIVEVLGSDDRPVEVGDRGRTVITTLGNRGYPGIRYLQGDAVTHLGRSSAFPGCGVIDGIQRLDSGEIGDSRLPYSEIEMMPRLLLQRGIPVRALQVARRRDGLMDVPVFRIETSVQNREQIEQAVLEVFTRNIQMKDMVEGGMIHPPVVELYSIGALSRGRLKVPIYLDERYL